MNVSNAPETPLPTVSITSPTSAESFTAPATLNVNVGTEAPAGRTVTEVQYYVNGAFVNLTRTPPFAITWSGPSGRGLTSGTYQITAQATDSTGAVGPLSTPVTIVVGADQRPPTVSISSPGVGDVPMAPATITVSANAQANPDRTLVEVAFYNGTTLLGTDTTAPYSFQWPNVPEGTYAITARATDSAGAITTSAVRLVEVAGSDQAPTVSILSPASGTSMTAPATVALYAQARAGLHRSIRRVEIFNGETLLGWSPSSALSDQWLNVPAGNYRLTARATDNLGVVTTSAPVDIAVVAEPVPVQISMGWPAAGEVIRSTDSGSATAYLQGTTPQVSRVEFLLNRNGVNTTLTGSWTQSNPLYASLDGTSFRAGGNYSIVARALDAAGNELARSPARQFTRSTAPNIVLQDPTNFSEYASPATVTVRGYTQMPIGVPGFPTFDRVEIYLGQVLVTANARIGTTSQFTATVPDLPEGQHDIRIRAISSDGAASEEVRRVRVLAPNDPARLYISRPTEGALLPQSGNSVVSFPLLQQWPDLATARIEGFGPSGQSFSRQLTRPDFSINLAPILAGNWRTRVVATTNQGATRVSDWVNFVVYRRSITTSSNTSLSSVPTPGVAWLVAQAEDCTGCIEAVEFRNGDTVLARVTEAPYQFNLSTLPVGSYSITARMLSVDASRGYANSTARAVTVVANAIPTVAITSPTAGATLEPSQSVTLAATATDANGTIARVDFYSGDTLLGTRTAVPYALSWQPEQPGDHALTARATDNHGAVGTSAVVNVRVGGTPPDPEARETITYIHTDLSGSPLVATNANGNVVWKENYRAYGERRLGQPGSEGQRQWFHGKEADAGTGLQYFGARYYDPAVGRFMGVDPVTFREDNLHSFNRYAYGNNNPVRYFDPDGRWAEDIVLGLPSMAVGSVSMSNNYKQGNYLAAVVDGIGLIADTAAVALPGVPGGAGLGILAYREGAELAAKGFASEAKLLGHFEKHGAEFGAKTANDYLQIGRDIMQNGTKVQYLYKGETRTGYAQFMGNTRRGDAKFGFVGTNADGVITTIHTESGKSFWKMLNGDPKIKTITPAL